MDRLGYDYNSPRAQKARVGKWFDKVKLNLLSGLTILLIFIGLLLISMGTAVGWLFVGFAAIPAMIVEWYEGELRHLRIITNSDSIDSIVSGTVLGRLSKQLTPSEIATVVSMLPGGQFFAVRFGIGSSFLRELASVNPDDVKLVWKEALNLYKQTGSKNVSDAILVVALIKSTPNYQTLLNHLQLDVDDLVNGIDWYNHLRELVEHHRRPQRTGGLARDWTFGWTPLLNRFGQNISMQVGTSLSAFKLAAHEEALSQLMSVFTKGGRQSVVLVGQPGSGKTEVVSTFASRLMDGHANVPESLRYRQVFNLDSSALIAAAPGRGGIEQLIPNILGEAYHAKNVIICLDNAQLFFENGVGSIDITNVLLPIIEAGNLRIILTVDEQRYLQISKQNPELVNALTRISIEPANHDQTIDILQDQSIMVEFRNHVTFMYQAFQEVYRLGDRYMHERVMPGKAVKLLETSAGYGQNGLVTANSVRTAIEKTIGVKVGTATDQDERKKLLNLEELIHGRMINQTRAVKVVSDALRRARAGVRNQNRPIGTFLFLGPTGVGKTELAKSLADIYFGGEDKIIRVDMNEYVGSDDVNRLIADAVDNSHSLTAQAMKQPFSVILLDEIEKAHPNVLSTLLQLLDEGILRDVKNREVSFRDAIIIATSNAGADRIREYIERGLDIEKFEDQFVDELISSHQFLPEFLNRFDEIVVFRPLKKPELLQVVDIMIASVNKTLALQKITVDVAKDAKEYLVEAGYDPRLGARPMRRIVQRVVENTVAHQMLSGSVEPGSVISISLDQVKQLVDSKVNADQIVADSK